MLQSLGTQSSVLSSLVYSALTVLAIYTFLNGIQTLVTFYPDMFFDNKKLITILKMVQK